MRALSRKKANRESLLRNLATSLVLYEKVTTTTAKAKEVKPVVERLIQRAKKNDLSARRYLMSFFFDENATKKTLEVLVPRYKNVKSGFVLLYKIGPRVGDGAEQSLLELKKVKIELPKTEEKKDEPKDKVKDAKKPSKTK